MAQWFLGLFHYFRAEMQPPLDIVGRLLQVQTSCRTRCSSSRLIAPIGVTLVDLGQVPAGDRAPRRGSRRFVR